MSTRRKGSTERLQAARVEGAAGRAASKHCCLRLLHAHGARAPARLPATWPDHFTAPPAAPSSTLPPCSKDIKVCGLLGPASALEKKSPLVSDQVGGRRACCCAALHCCGASDCSVSGAGVGWAAPVHPARPAARAAAPVALHTAHPPSLHSAPSPLRQVIGVGGTTAWKLCTLSPGTTLAVVYDIVAQHGGPLSWR